MEWHNNTFKHNVTQIVWDHNVHIAKNISLPDSTSTTTDSHSSGHLRVLNTASYVPLNITYSEDSKIRLPPLEIQKRTYLRELINLSVHEWSVYYRSTTIALIAICFLFMILWMKAKFPLFYKIYLLKYYNNEENDKKLTLWKKFKLALYTIYSKNHINSLIYMFIIGLTAVTSNLDIIYCFLLLAMANLDATLKNIIHAISLKYKQIILTLVLSFIIVWTISTIGFVFFNSHFDSIFQGVCILIYLGS
jgi:hypothetical protein